MDIRMKLWRRVLVALGLVQLARFIAHYVKKRRIKLYYSEFYPIATRTDHPVLGFAKVLGQNIDRILHMREDLMEDVELETGQRHDTIVTMTPITTSYVILMSRDPEITKFILKDEFDSFVKTDNLRKIFSDFISTGIFSINHGSTSPENRMWVFQRKTSSKIFTKNIFTGHVRSTLEKNINKIITHVDKKLGDSEDGSCTIPMKQKMYCFTMDSIGDIGFGVDFNSLDEEKVPPFSKAFDEVVYTLVYRTIIPMWHVLGRVLPSERKIKAGMKILEKLSTDIISKRKSETLEGKGDILSLFLQADPNLSNDQLKDIILSFLLAGRDTTACTLSFVFYLLATHPEKQEKLFEEVDEFFQKTTDVTLDNLQQLRFLDGVVFESLRLFPPVPADGKSAARDVVLPNGVLIKKGTCITFEPYLMGRDETRYENAGSFIPSRWMKPGRSTQEYDQYIFPVFQGGPRICLGKDLAFYEMKMLIVELVKRYRFVAPADITPIDRTLFEKDVGILNGETVYKAGITLSFKKDLNLKLFRR